MTISKDKARKRHKASIIVTSRIRRPLSEVDRLRVLPLSAEILERIATLVEQMPAVTDWLAAKKALMLELCPADRQLFSKRDDVTRCHQPFNEFEKRVREAWVAAGGQLLLMPDHKKMVDAAPDAYL